MRKVLGPLVIAAIAAVGCTAGASTSAYASMLHTTSATHEIAPTHRSAVRHLGHLHHHGYRHGPSRHRHGPHRAPLPKAITVEVAHTLQFGEVFADSKGQTLYRYAPEAANSIVCTGTCLNRWIPVLHTAGAAVRMPPGSSDVLTLVLRPNGTRQIALDGHPLYRYAGDHAPGDANGDLSAANPRSPWRVMAVPRK